jgi:hypothetical protein
MAKGNVGELTIKPLLQKKNKGEGCWELSEEESTKTLRVHSTLHLQSARQDYLYDLMISD